jgi:protein-S-isoprenylcysteine O-methyltransferase Ste14
MIITDISQIINVWANDANKVALFMILLYLPYNIFLIAIVAKDILTKRQYLIEIIFLIIFLLAMISLVGVGQLILEDFFDAFIRCIGFIIFINASFFSLIVFFNKNEIRNRFVRFPEYFVYISISIGISFLSLSVLSLFLTIVVLIPSINLKINKIEKILIENDKNYIDYKNGVPKLIPDIKKILKYIKL